MTNAANITTEENTLRISHDGLVLSYSAATDRRVADADDGKLWAKSLKGARELAAEIRAWGVEATASNYAVTF